MSSWESTIDTITSDALTSLRPELAGCSRDAAKSKITKADEKRVIDIRSSVSSNVASEQKEINLYIQETIRTFTDDAFSLWRTTAA